MPRHNKHTPADPHTDKRKGWAKAASVSASLAVTASMLVSGAYAANAQDQIQPLASTPTQGEADAACAATPQPDADQTRALVIGNDIVCETVFTTPTSWPKFGAGNYINDTTKNFAVPSAQPTRIDMLAVGSGASGFRGDVMSSVPLPYGDGGVGGQMVVVENVSLPAGINKRVLVPTGGGLDLNGTPIANGP